MKKTFSLIVVALVASMSVAGVALADDTEETTEGAVLRPQIIIDEENGTITIGLPLDGELPECPPEEPEEEDGVDEEVPVDDVVEPATYGPGDCIEFVIDHPSGKTHHGAIVSTVAKNLHPSMLEGIKKGQIMRYVAKTGKLPDGDGDGDGEVMIKVKKDKSEKGNSKWAKNKDKPNKGHNKLKPNKTSRD